MDPTFTLGRFGFNNRLPYGPLYGDEADGYRYNLPGEAPLIYSNYAEYGAPANSAFPATNGPLDSSACPHNILASPTPRGPEHVTPLGYDYMREGDMDMVAESVEGEGVEDDMD